MTSGEYFNPHFITKNQSENSMTNTNTNKKYSREEMISTIKHYDKYFKIDRTNRNLYIISTSINGFVNNNDLENPNQYLLYLVADKNLQSIKNKKDYLMISELITNMENDLFLFQPENYNL